MADLSIIDSKPLPAAGDGLSIVKSEPLPARGGGVLGSLIQTAANTAAAVRHPLDTLKTAAQPGDDSAFGTAVKDAMAVPTMVGKAVVNASQLKHGNYQPMLDSLKDTGRAVANIPRNVSTDVRDGKWGKLGVRAAEVAIPGLGSEEGAAAVGRLADAAGPPAAAIKGAAAAGVKAATSPRTMIGAGTAEYLASHLGIPPGVASAAVVGPRIVGQAIKGAKSALADRAGTAPSSSIPISAIDQSELPVVAQGLGPVRPPLAPSQPTSNIKSAPVNAPPIPPSGGRAPISPPLRTSTGAIIPVPPAEAPIPVVKANIPPAPRTGVPMRAPITSTSGAPIENPQATSGIPTRRRPPAAQVPGSGGRTPLRPPIASSSDLPPSPALSTAPSTVPPSVAPTAPPGAPDLPPSAALSRSPIEPNPAGSPIPNAELPMPYKTTSRRPPTMGDVTQLNRDLHGAASGSGLGHDALSDVMALKFGVKSMKELTFDQMRQAYRDLTGEEWAPGLPPARTPKAAPTGAPPPSTEPPILIPGGRF